jgi:DNA-binding protein H-NS
MTTPADDATRAMLERAQAIHAERMAALQPLAELAGERKQLQAALAALDEEYGHRYAAAEKAGWAEDELTALDAPPPVRRPRGRPAKRAVIRKTATKATANGSGEHTRGTIPGQADGAGADSHTNTTVQTSA